MHETPDEIRRLQQLMDQSAAAAGPHLRFDLSDPAGAGQRQAMLDHYLPLQGPGFAEWLERSDALGARIVAEKLFVFHLDG